MGIKLSGFNTADLLRYALLSFALLPILPNRLKGLPPILLLLSSATYFFGNKPVKDQKPDLKFFAVFSLPFFFLLFSLIYSSNIAYGIKKMETELPILVIPLAFFILMNNYRIEPKLFFNWIKLYISCATLYAIYVLVSIILDPTPFFKDFYSNKFRNVVKSLEIAPQHPIYASIFFALAIVFGVFFFRKIFNRKIWGFVSVTLNAILLVMLSSRSVILALMITLFLLFLLVFRVTFKRKMLIVVTLFFSILILFSYNRRMQELLKFDTYTRLDRNFSTGFRVAITECSFKLIRQNPWWGYGIGDVQQQLNDCYKEISPLLLEKTYNSHNQYLDFWLKTGILGFIYFLSLLFYLFRYGIKHKNYLPGLIVLFYAAVFLFENVLDRRSGVILFYFLLIFLIKYYSNEQEKKYA